MNQAITNTNMNGKHGMTEKKPLRKGQGRRQIIACQSRIQELIAQGYDVRMVYDALCSEGLITISYGGFYDFVTQRKRVKRSKVQLLMPGAELSPLLPASPIIQPVSPSSTQQDDAPLFAPQPTAAVQSKAISPIASQKPDGLIPPPQNSPGPSDKVERGRAMQAMLDNTIKRNNQLMQTATTDPELQKAAAHLVHGTDEE